MLARRIQLPQSAARQCLCHRDSVGRFSTGGNNKKSSSSSSWSSSPPWLSSPFSPSFSPTPASPSSPSPSSIYDKLFRTNPATTKVRPPVSQPPPRSDHGNVSRPTRRKGGAQGDDGQDIDVSHVGEELKAWLEGAGASTATQVAREKPDSELPGGKPVVVLSSLSRSLVASDFYRWAPQGRHVAGWAGGISKVVQALSPITREPRGQYFLFFDTWDAAHRCHDQLTKAYRLTNTNESPDQPKPSPAPEARTKSENEGSASDGLPFPTTPLELRVEPQIMPTVALQDLINSAAAADPPGPHRGIPTPSSTVPYRLGAHLAHRAAPTNDLSWSVLVHLTGGKITLDGMTKAIAADGAARNLPWRLVEPRPDVEWWPRPVQGYGYTRFVITFVDAAEGRRFARAWHRREIVDDEWTNGVMTVNTTALW
ncbi:hypothetical protein B0I37DRAFT_368047 [Chaetomium sp. MPI-CAGE-AT-0009]|nr:hypothetical protein B0I37DRAFT_368047 [Chaetomium sp. MPI-CAGE-AT-0009]